jgi:exo-beta-1,3-glucanase (GH17 family)
MKLKLKAFTRKANSYGYENLLSRIEDFAESLKVGATPVTYNQFEELSGLDPRSYVKMWIADDALITAAGSALPYYGGFEYVDKEHKVTVGNYVIYSNEDSRVSNLIDNLLGVGEDEEDEA